MNKQGKYTFKVWNTAGTEFMTYTIDAYGESDAKSRMTSALSYTYDWKPAEAKLIGFEEINFNQIPTYNSTGYSSEQWLQKIDERLRQIDERTRTPRL